MGLLLQLSSNAASRLAYVLLIALLSKDGGVDAIRHCSILGVAMGVMPLLSLNIYTYVISQASNSAERAIASAVRQYLMLQWLIFIALLLAICAEAFELTKHNFLPILLVAAEFALIDVIFAISTLNKIAYRSILYYGVQAFFYIFYLLGFHFNLALSQVILIPLCLVHLINIFIFNQCIGINEGLGSFVKASGLPFLALKSEYSVRLNSLVVSLPVVFSIPLLIGLLNNGIGGSSLIPELLLFQSVVGAVVFLLGNIYQFYGVNILAKALEILKSGDLRVINLFLFAIVAVSCLLSPPVNILISYLKGGVGDWPLEWYFAAPIVAAGVAATQWYSALYMAFNRQMYVMTANFIYIALLAITFWISTGIPRIADSHWPIAIAFVAATSVRSLFQLYSLRSQVKRNLFR